MAAPAFCRPSATAYWSFEERVVAAELVAAGLRGRDGLHHRPPGVVVGAVDLLAALGLRELLGDLAVLVPGESLGSLDAGLLEVLLVVVEQPEVLPVRQRVVLLGHVEGVQAGQVGGVARLGQVRDLRELPAAGVARVVRDVLHRDHVGLVTAGQHRGDLLGVVVGEDVHRLHLDAGVGLLEGVEQRLELGRLGEVPHRDGQRRTAAVATGAGLRLGGAARGDGEREGGGCRHGLREVASHGGPSWRVGSDHCSGFLSFEPVSGLRRSP